MKERSSDSITLTFKEQLPMNAIQTKQKKILYLITKSNWGGAQRYVYDLATQLPSTEFEVVVALGGNGPLLDKLKNTDIRTISLPSLQRDVSIVKDVRAFFEIIKILRTERPDIFHINSSKAGVFGALAGRLAGVPKIIFTAHGWAFNEDRPTWQRIILKTLHWLTVLFTHHTIAVSKEVRRQMNWPLVKNKLRVIYNGRQIVSLASRSEARDFLIQQDPSLSKYRDDFWSLTIAELHPIKRHDAVIEAIKEVVKFEPNTRHIIIGTGEEENKLKNLIDNNQLSEHIFLLGQIDEAAQYIKSADIFILASRSEALPYVPIEACIAGVPTVATAVGGIPEIIEDRKSGLLTPPLDNKALFEGILELRRNTELRSQLAAGASRRASLFKFETTLAKTIDLYTK